MERTIYSGQFNNPQLVIISSRKKKIAKMRIVLLIVIIVVLSEAEAKLAEYTHNGHKVIGADGRITVGDRSVFTFCIFNCRF